MFDEVKFSKLIEDSVFNGTMRAMNTWQKTEGVTTNKMSIEVDTEPEAKPKPKKKTAPKKKKEEPKSDELDDLEDVPFDTQDMTHEEFMVEVKNIIKEGIKGGNANAKVNAIGYINSTFGAETFSELQSNQYTECLNGMGDAL